MTPLTLPPDWPFRLHSRFVHSRPHLWHVQDIGTGFTLLLLHGAGGATHSFRHLIPLLHGFRVIAIDVSGQGFTVNGARHRCGLDAIAEDIATLIAHEHWQPDAIIGHSAGAAIALRLAEITPTRAVIGINAALGTFEGLQGWLFPAAAKLLALTPLVPQVFSRLAGTPGQVHQLLASTGSRIDAAGEAQYLTLVRMPSHVDATLSMMSQWQLDALLDGLPRHSTPCLLITSSGDRAVPAAVSQKAVAMMPDAHWVDLPSYGHLVHEEAADKVAALILTFLTQPEKGVE